MYLCGLGVFCWSFLSFALGVGLLWRAPVGLLVFPVLLRINNEHY